MEDVAHLRVMHDFLWGIAELQSQLEEIYECWAKQLGITQPQWLMLSAIADLDADKRGVAGVEIASRLRVHAAFVAAQTKQLEIQGWLTRRQSKDDARYVLMSLTVKAENEILKLAKSRELANATLFNDVDKSALSNLSGILWKIARNAQLTARLLQIDAS